MDPDENLDCGICRRCCGMVIIFVVLPLLIIPCSVIYGELGSSQTYSLYPGQTRITSRSSTACQGVSISADRNSAAVHSYLLLSPPPLGATNRILLAVRADVSPDDLQYWMFHFYSGSTYSMAACLTQGNSLDYYVKGNQDFNGWYNQHRPDRYSLGSDGVRSFSDLKLMNPCGTSISTDSLSFSSEDDYYFVVYNTGVSIASVQIWFSFDLTEYSTPEYSSIISNCTATGATSCSLDVPYTSADYTVLLKTDPPLDGRWGTPMQVTTSCVTRSWVYAVIEVCMVITSILVLLPFCWLEILSCQQRHARIKITPTVPRFSASPDPNLIDISLQASQTTSDSSPAPAVESKADLITLPHTASPTSQSGYNYSPPGYIETTPMDLF